MTLKFQLKKDCYSLTFDEIKQYIKDKVITVDDLELIIRIEVLYLYNDLIDYFNINNSGGISNNTIVNREIIENYIQERHNNKLWLFGILKQNNIIGVCGRGYTFDCDKFTITNDEYNRLMYLNWDLGLMYEAD